MKKLIFGGFAVLLAFALIACDGLLPNGTGSGDDDGDNNIVKPYSMTIYLDGGVPDTNMSRALNTERTRMGHDFYEVVFVHKDSGGAETVARATWEYGQPVSISGVVRGVAYNNTGVPGNGTGSAILFVGRQSDMTLLAVGSITAVDGGAANTAFTNNTKSVTFSVAALQAGASMTPANSSFLLSSDDDEDNISTTATVPMVKTVSGKSFPMFSIPKDAEIAAHYQLGSAGTYTGSAMSGATSLSNNLSSYIGGIRLDGTINASTAASSPSLNKRDPRFSAGGLYTYISAGSGLDAITTIEPVGDTATAVAGDALPNPIQFKFDSTGADKGIFSFNFEIPVYAISKTAGTQAANIWKVRPAYGPNVGDLDDGLRGVGGCILIGTDINALDPIQIITK